MGRTNIDIDDDLIERVMRRYDLATKKEAVDFALHSLISEPMSREEALGMEGAGWAGDLEEMRAPRVGGA